MDSKQKPILDEHFVFRWIHWSFMRNDATIAPSGFNPHQGTISVFWDRLISANQTLLLTKRPEDNGIAQIQAKDARDYQPIPLDVKPDPNELSAAHSIICDKEYENFDRLGKQDLNEIKMYLSRRAQMVITPKHRSIA